MVCDDGTINATMMGFCSPVADALVLLGFVKLLEAFIL